VEKNTKAAGNALIVAIKEWAIKRGLRVVVAVSKKNVGGGAGNSIAPVNEVLAS
jgi:hypothetical protein